jgi:hypothetical protein
MSQLFVPLLSVAIMSATVQKTVDITLPTGVNGIMFGTAQRYKDASGKEMCAIVRPTADPVAFERGVTEISYAVALKPRVVKSASARVIAPAGQELRTVPCNAFTLVTGGFSQTQLGSTISRIDRAPLISGSYRLRIDVDGQIAEIGFTIK